MYDGDDDELGRLVRIPGLVISENIYIYILENVCRCHSGRPVRADFALWIQTKPLLEVIECDIIISAT